MDPGRSDSVRSSSMSTATRREHRRYRVRAECVVRSCRDDRLISDQTLDVSWSGIRVSALQEARLGERVKVSVRIPGSITWLDADGEITRLCAGRRLADGGSTLGVRLRRMDGMLRLLLATVARGYPAIAPQRGGCRDYARAVLRIADGIGEL